jgi:hypothetical protein
MQVARRERARSWGHALRALCALAMLLAGACAEGRRQLFAPKVRMGELLVRVHGVEVDDRRVRVKLSIENHSASVMRIDRAGIALRLSDGRYLAPLSNRDLYEIDPGDDHRMHVEFSSDAWAASARQAALVIGGVRFAHDPYPRALGELPLSDDPAIAQQTLLAVPLPPWPAAPAPAPPGAQPAP